MVTPQLAWKRRIGLLYRSLAAQRHRRIVLIYHAVGPGPGSLPVEKFEWQLDWLARNAQVVPLETILAGEPGAPLQVALTFDDGYACLARSVAPLLSRWAMPAAVFLNTACIGEESARPSDPEKGHTPGQEFLLWSEVEMLYRSGWSIGSHGADHVDLTRLPRDEVRVQLQSSKAAIEARLGAPCTQFAYTWGNHSARVRAAVAECGYGLAVAGTHGTVSRSGDRFAIPRIDIRSDYEAGDFVAVVRGDWDYLRPWQHARRLLK